MNKLHVLALSTSLLSAHSLISQEVQPEEQQEVQQEEQKQEPQVVDVKRIRKAEVMIHLDATNAFEDEKESALEIIARKGSETLQELNEKTPRIRGTISLTGLELIDEATDAVTAVVDTVPTVVQADVDEESSITA